MQRRNSTAIQMLRDIFVHDVPLAAIAVTAVNFAYVTSEKAASFQKACKKNLQKHPHNFLQVRKKPAKH